MADFLKLSLIAGLLSACAAAPRPVRGEKAATSETASEAPRWFFAAGGSPRAVALVVHGLNLKPSRMDFLADRLASLGIDCYRPVLTGHDGDLAAFKAVTRARWLQEVALAYDQAAARARTLGVPLHLVGFSLGGLLALDLTTSRPDAAFDRMVLFAPAIAPKFFARLTRLLGPFPSLVLPSASPPDYRVHAGTPIAAYSSLLNSASAVASTIDGRADRPTIVFLDPNDEVIGARDLARFIQRKRLHRWTVVEISNRDSTLEERFHHLITDDRAVGAAQWEKMERLIARHLQLDGRR